MSNSKPSAINFHALAQRHKPLLYLGTKHPTQTTKKLRWALTVMGITGATLNALGLGICFIIWIIANIGWIAVNIQRRSWPEAALFSAYLATSILGLFTWGLS